MTSSSCRWALVLFVFLSGSCKKKENVEPVSPAPTPAPTPTVQQPAPAVTNTPPPARPVAWPHLPPDARLPDAKVTVVTAPKPVSTDADIAKFKEEKERQESEKAVEGAVTGALSGVKRCFEAQKVSAGSYKLRVRVHRSGRVLSSGVGGAGPELNRCVERALGGLQVPNLKTDTIDVEREIKYTN